MSARVRARRTPVGWRRGAVGGMALCVSLGTTSVAADVPDGLGAELPDGVSTAWMSASPEGARPASRPNIVTIMADDMRVDDLQWMPRTRRLIGAQGVRFANSFSPYPLCCPARASFLTGRYAHNHGVWSHQDPFGFAALDDSRTLPVWLSRAGYRTGFVGKYLNGYGRQRTSAGGPSATYVPPGWTDWRGAVDGADGGGTYRYFNTTLNVNGRLVDHPGQYQTPMLTDHVLEMVSDFSATDKPFFVTASYVAPHHGAPDEADDPSPALRRDDGKRSSVKTPARPDWVRGRFDRQIRQAPGRSVRGEDVRTKPSFIRRLPAINRAEWAALATLTRQRAETLHILDLQVQRIVRRLKRLGELSDTVIAFTSDNGYFLGEHRLRQGKVLPYEPALRTPLLIRGPGMPQGATRVAPVTILDLPVTFASLAGSSTAAADGRSLLPVIRRDEGWRTGVVTETGPRRVFNSGENAAVLARGSTTVLDGDDPRFSLGLRTDRWLYVRHQSGEYELYDMARDARQLLNLAGVRRYAAVEKSMAAALHRLRDCRGDACQSLLPKRLRVSNRLIVSGRDGG